jgi:hypothetical protein
LQVTVVLTSLNTLNGDSAGVGSATGFFEPLAVGPDKCGRWCFKATFQTTPGWQNQFVNIGGAGLTGSQFYDAYIAANSVAPSGAISHFIMSPALLAAYRNQLFAQERFIDSTKLDGGRMALAFNGAIAEQDPEMGFNCSVAGNVDGYMLNYDGIKLIFHSDADFAVSPFEYISGTTARAAQLYVKCQLVADFLGGQAMLINL